VHWLERVIASLAQAGPVTAADLTGELARDWAEWLPAYALWLPMPAGAGERTARGGLLLARDIPWLEHEVALLAEWADVVRHACSARAQPLRFTPAAIGARIRRRRDHEQVAGLPWWRRRAVQAAFGVAALLCLPVRLTVLAPGELVPANPATVRAPLEGVIERFDVKPNQLVKKGQPLFAFDQAQLASRAEVAAQALATAEAEYRQALQQALADGKSKAQLATLQGKIEERRAETGFLRGQAERAHVLAPRDGIAIFDDPGEWIGRPVVTGERVKRIAASNDVEVEAWLGIGDAIPVAAGDPVSLYLAAGPFDTVAAKVRYLGYEAVARPDGSYAYRVRATLDGASGQRVGLKGTARLSGPWVPMAYWMLRRPLAAARQALGW